jgi:hypothetical protein
MSKVNSNQTDSVFRANLKTAMDNVGIGWDDLSELLNIPGLRSYLSHGPSCLYHDE